MEWISVKDKLPEPEQIVLACLNKPYRRLNHPYEENVLLLYRREFKYIDGYKIDWKRPFGGETVNYNDMVTHWMPIPQLPNGI